MATKKVIQKSTIDKFGCQSENVEALVKEMGFTIGAKPKPKRKFRVGDLVQVVSHGSTNPCTVGLQGVVKVIDTYGDYAVEFPVHVNGHTCMANGKAHAEDGYGWWYEEEKLKLIRRKK